MKEQKKEILIELRCFVDKYMLEGDLTEVIKYIKSLPSKAKENNKEIQQAHRFSIRQDTEWGYGDNESHDVYHLQCYRWETNDEYAARIEKEHKNKITAKEREKIKNESKIKREKTLYENLKKKFENK